MSGTTVRLVIHSRGVMGVMGWSIQRQRWLESCGGINGVDWRFTGIKRDQAESDRYGEFWIRDETLATQFVLRWA